MKKRKRTVTTIETRETITLHAGAVHPGTDEKFRPRCPHCNGAGILTLDEAAMLAGVTALAIYRWVETKQIHFLGSPSGVLWICPLSIQKIQARESKSPGRRQLQ